MTIGELSELTGVGAQTLRMWESRHGFPRPRRLESGHRRYAVSDAALVRAIASRRDEGLRLDVAIDQVTAQRLPTSPPVTSVYAHLRRHHPEAPMHRLRKSTLIGLSWAIEDEFAAKAERAHLFGAFERSANYVTAASRWRALARVAGSAHVFADFGAGSQPGGTLGDDGPWRVALDAGHPMSREWAVVCDAVELPVALSAWEVPGQERVRDRDRLFEAVWTIDPAAVRAAARVCATVALEAGSPHAAETLRALDRPVSSPSVDPASVTRLVGRIVAYVDEASDTSVRR